MPWAQFDDHSADTLAWIKAGGEALGLHLLVTLWCAAHLSDGCVPDEIVALLGPRFVDLDAMIARLVDAGLWERVEGGWRLPAFLCDNRSRAEVEADRANARKRASAGGRAKAAKDRAARNVKDG